MENSGTVTFFPQTSRGTARERKRETNTWRGAFAFPTKGGNLGSQTHELTQLLESDLAAESVLPFSDDESTDD